MPVSPASTQAEWSKTKEITISCTDNGVGGVQIGFNNEGAYKLAGKSGNTFSRAYTLTGDVYGSTVAAIYFKDSVGNDTTQFLTIYNLDNTAPTITDIAKAVGSTGRMNLTVTANDYSSVLNASGSGVSAYGVSASADVQPSGWQDSNVVTVGTNGTYYVWARDAVGNVSLPKEITVTELTVDIKGSVRWVDKDNAHDTRPSGGAAVTLYRDGVPADTKTGFIQKNANEFVFKDLEKYSPADGHEYAYTVEQGSIVSKQYPGDQYTTTRSGNVFTNKLGNASGDEPRGFCVGGAITWKDSDDKLGYRPHSVAVTLFQNGVQYGNPATVDAFSQNKYEFTRLPKYDSSLNRYEYTVQEAFRSVYVIQETGEIVDAYDIVASHGFDFVNIFHIEDNTPTIPVRENYHNTLIFNTASGSATVTLKAMEMVYTDALDVIYTGNCSGLEYNFSANEMGTVLENINSGKYEIDVTGPGWELEKITVSIGDHVKVYGEDGKYYLEIEHISEDTEDIVTLDMGRPGHIGYSTTATIRNSFSPGNRLSD